MRLKYFIKRTSEYIGVDTLSQKIWFKFLAYKNGVNLFVRADLVYISKDGNTIILKKGKKDFGSSGLVVRDFDSFFNAVEPEKIEGKNVVDFSTLKLHTIKGSEDKFYFHNICEPEHVTNLYIEKSEAKEGDIIFDVGAYCGTQAIYWSKIVGATGKVICLEPDETNYNILQKNIALHGEKNVIASKVGAYSENKEINFSNNGSMGSQVIENKNKNSTSIQVKTLETIFNELKLPKIDFIKMDIEGAEIEAIRPALSFIQTNKIRLIIEPHYIKGTLNDMQIIEMFNSINYNVDVLKQGDYDYQPLLYAYPKPNLK